MDDDVPDTVKSPHIFLPLMVKLALPWPTGSPIVGATSLAPVIGLARNLYFFCFLPFLASRCSLPIARGSTVSSPLARPAIQVRREKRLETERPISSKRRPTMMSLPDRG